jgi:hypothetical protein
MTWQDVPGWFDWMDLYDEVALTTPPYSTIVEVGVAFGRSLLYLAQKIKETGRPGIRIVAVDKWEPYDEAAFIWDRSKIGHPSEVAAFEYAQAHGGLFPAFLHNIRESGLSDIIYPMRCDSVQAAESFIALKIKPHFVFIDAEHTAEAVQRDIDYWWDTGPEWMAGHDYNRGLEDNFPGVWKTVDAKWGQENVEWRGQTCFVVRRSHLETIQL